MVGGRGGRKGALWPPPWWLSLERRACGVGGSGRVWAWSSQKARAGQCPGSPASPSDTKWAQSLTPRGQER